MALSIVYGSVSYFPVFDLLIHRQTYVYSESLRILHLKHHQLLILLEVFSMFDR
ncbi:unnamed protein product [Brugia timori]|uniref:Uncharacterized protein n=1 Tax=Brugia timori TaxID=42155 RepID=A0A0R3QGB2_9BILA|nr:unnamed protein product [Brugia timori]